MSSSCPARSRSLNTLLRVAGGAVLSIASLTSDLVGQPAQVRRQGPAPIERRAPEAAAPAPRAGYAQSGAAPTQSSGYPSRPAAAGSRAGGNSAGGNGPLVDPSHPNQTQQHLGQWMQSHRNLPLAQQQSALENERGFRQLPLQTQQRMHNRLAQLNNMAPERQQQVIARTEAMEHLAPAQRQQVRDALAGVGVLPEDRRHVVSRTFFMLRDLPPDQRTAYMSSPQFRGQFNDQERAALGNLLNVAPMYPPLQANPSRQPAPR